MWRPFKAFHSTIILQRGNHEWGRLPYYRIIMESLMCLWKKCTLSTVLVTNHPLHSSTENSCGPSKVGNNTRIVCGSPSGGCVLPLMSPSRVHAMLSLLMYHQKTCWQFLTTVRVLQPCPLSGPIGESFPHHPPFVSCIRLGPHCAAGTEYYPKCPPNFFKSPTLSKNPFKVSNDPCSQTGSADTTRLSSA